MRLEPAWARQHTVKIRVRVDGTRSQEVDFVTVSDTIAVSIEAVWYRAKVEFFCRRKPIAVVIRAGICGISLIQTEEVFVVVW